MKVLIVLFVIALLFSITVGINYLLKIFNWQGSKLITDFDLYPRKVTFHGATCRATQTERTLQSDDIFRNFRNEIRDRSIEVKRVGGLFVCKVTQNGFVVKQWSKYRWKKGNMLECKKEGMNKFMMCLFQYNFLRNVFLCI